MKPWLLSTNNTLIRPAGTLIEEAGDTVLIHTTTGYKLQNIFNGNVFSLRKNGINQSNTTFADLFCIAAELSINHVVWANSARSQYFLWSIDNNANFIQDFYGGDMGGVLVPGFVNNLDYFFLQDINLDGVIGNVTPGDLTTIENIGNTRLLASLSSGIFVQSTSIGTQPLIAIWNNTVRVFTNTYAGYEPLGAVQLNNGNYNIAWANPSRTDWFIWIVDKYGMYRSDINTNAAGIVAYETLFGQDFNNNGTIGT